MLVYRSLNALGCLRIASATVFPDSTSNTTSRTTAANALFSLWRARMSRACTSGRPALIIVENCRVKITMSRMPIDPPVFFGVDRDSSTLMIVRRWRRSWATASSRLGASIVADLSSPLVPRAV